MQGTRLFDRYQEDGEAPRRNVYPGIPQDGILVFVYGTLMTDGGLHPLIKDETYLGEATIAGRLFDLGPYPGWTQNVALPDDRVLGEIYRVSEEALRRLDYAEGVEHGLYERRAVIAHTERPKSRSEYYLPVWAYHYQRDTHEHQRIQQESGHRYFVKPFASWDLTKVGH